MSLHYIQGTGPAATPLFYPQIPLTPSPPPSNFDRPGASTAAAGDLVFPGGPSAWAGDPASPGLDFPLYPVIGQHPPKGHHEGWICTSWELGGGEGEPATAGGGTMCLVSSSEMVQPICRVIQDHS